VCVYVCLMQVKKVSQATLIACLILLGEIREKGKNRYFIL